MRRALWGLPLLAVTAAVVGGALSVDHAPRAQAQTPAVEIHRVQEASAAPISTRSKPIFILALGSDARPGEPVDRLRADSIHIVGVNVKKGAASILGFPRDSYVSIPGAGTRRINEGMFYGGPELMVDTVESITNIPIDYYLLTSFEGTVDMVNKIGGLRVDVPYEMSDAASGSDFEPGPQRLNGSQALAFSRDRHSTPNGDFGRSENQGRLIQAALAKLHKDFEKDPHVLLRFIQAGLAHIQTDLPLTEVFDLMASALSIDPDKVTNLVATGGGMMVGGASVVQLSSSNEATYADMREDGLIGS